MDVFDQAGLDAWHAEAMAKIRRRYKRKAAASAERSSRKQEALNRWETEFFRSVGLLNSTKNPFA